MMKMELPRVVPVALVLTLILTATPAPSQEPAPAPESTAGGPATLQGDFKTAIVIDAETGLVLVAVNENTQRQPASMLKMMTELLVLERIASGDLAFEDEVTVSAKASGMGGSQVYLAHGEQFTVRELLSALAIHSANDAAVTLAEYVAGSTFAFVDLMNDRARRLGMTNSEFHSVHGLPAEWGEKPDLTTAHDLALLASELIRYPEALDWSSTAVAPFRDGEFTLYNPNKLVGKYRGLDGLKTGFTDAAGFCVTATAVQKGVRLISVVMGCHTDRARATETTRLLTFGFNQYEQVQVVEATGEALSETLSVKGGKRKSVLLTYGESLSVNVPRQRQNDIVVESVLPDDVKAPVAAGTEVGRARVSLDGKELGSVPIVALEEVAKGNWLDRLLH